MKEKMSHRLEFLGSTIEETTELLKGLAHPQRLKILLLVNEKPLNHTELANKLDIPKTTLSHNLNTLLHIQLIEKKERGIYNHFQTKVR
jgi:predicted transcriptional regulator